MEDIIIAIIMGAISLVFCVLGIRSFLGKGFLLNNAYIYASKKEREGFNKKPYYIQSGVVFCLIAMVFAINLFRVIFKAKWLVYLVIFDLVVTVIYAIISSILIEKSKKENK